MCGIALKSLRRGTSSPRGTAVLLPYLGGEPLFYEHMDDKFAAVLKLPLVKFAPAYAVGLIAGAFLPLPACAALVIAAAFGTALPKLLGRNISAGSLGFAVGILLMSLYMIFLYRPIAELGGKALRAECLVTGVESVRGDRAVYIVKLHAEGLPVTARLFGEDIAQTGDRFEALIEFNEADEGYGSIAYGIDLTGNLQEIALINRGFSLEGAANALRERTISLIRRNIGGDEGALAVSMLFGDSSLLSAELEEAVIISGTAHFTAVSGTHFAIFFAILLELMAGKHKMARAAISLVLVPVAVIFFGASASVIRSAIMLAICNCAPLLGRKPETLNSLCFAVVAMTATSPAVILNAGFQMSVLGVFGTAIVGERFYSESRLRLPGRLKRMGCVIKPVIVSACAVVCTAPVVLYFFGGVSLAGAFTSALLIPFIAAVMLFAILAGITGMPALLVPAAVLMKIICAVIKFIGGSGSLWLPMDFDGAVLLALICAALISLAGIAPKKLFGYGTGGFAALLLTSLTICAVLRSSRCRIELISDGSSGAAAVISKNTAVVYIAGTGAGFTGELSEALRKNGVLEIECIIAPELDSCGAVTIGHIADMIPTRTIYSPYMPERLCPESDVIRGSAEYISAGGITISAAKTGDTLNNADIVMYSGYVRSVPENSAGLAVYLSSTQRELPENGINISATNFEIELESIGEIIIR